MTRFTLRSPAHEIFLTQQTKVCPQLQQIQRYKGAYYNRNINVRTDGQISELQFVNCIQIHANDQLRRVAVEGVEWESGRVAERGSETERGVFAGNAPWNWSSHLKQFESAHMLSPKPSWTFAVPRQKIHTTQIQRYQRYRDTQMQLQTVWLKAREGANVRESVLCLMVDLLDLDLFPGQDLRICLIQSCLSSRLFVEPLITRATCRQGRR